MDSVLLAADVALVLTAVGAFAVLMVCWDVAAWLIRNRRRGE